MYKKWTVWFAGYMMCMYMYSYMHILDPFLTSTGPALGERVFPDLGQRYNTLMGIVVRYFQVFAMKYTSKYITATPESYFSFTLNC